MNWWQIYLIISASFTLGVMTGGFFAGTKNESNGWD